MSLSFDSPPNDPFKLAELLAQTRVERGDRAAQEWVATLPEWVQQFCLYLWDARDTNHWTVFVKFVNGSAGEWPGSGYVVLAYLFHHPEFALGKPGWVVGGAGRAEPLGLGAGKGMAEILLAHGAPVTAEALRGHVCCDDSELVELLLKRAGERAGGLAREVLPDASDEDVVQVLGSFAGWSDLGGLLHRTVSAEAARALLAAGANPLEIDAQGKTPLCRAFEALRGTGLACTECGEEPSKPLTLLMTLLAATLDARGEL